MVNRFVLPIQVYSCCVKKSKKKGKKKSSLYSCIIGKQIVCLCMFFRSISTSTRMDLYTSLLSLLHFKMVVKDFYIYIWNILTLFSSILCNMLCRNLVLSNHAINFMPAYCVKSLPDRLFINSCTELFHKGNKLSWNWTLNTALLTHFLVCISGRVTLWSRWTVCLVCLDLQSTYYLPQRFLTLA